MPVPLNPMVAPVMKFDPVNVTGTLWPWAPLFGLLLAATAYLTNRKSAGWKRTTSIVILVFSVLIHVAVAVLIAIG